MQGERNIFHPHEERESHGRLITPLVKRFATQAPKLLPALLICVLVSISHGTAAAQTTTKPTAPAAQTDAQRAFQKLKTLAGSWQGTIMNIPINFTIRAASSGTAILHEGNTDGEGPPKHEITMFYRDGDHLLATHFCDAGNRAHLQGKLSPDGNTIDFSFLNVDGSTKGGFVKRMALTIIDENRHVVEVTFIMPNGTPVELRGEFQRTK